MYLPFVYSMVIYSLKLTDLSGFLYMLSNTFTGVLNNRLC